MPRSVKIAPEIDAKLYEEMLLRFQQAVGGLGHVRGPYDRGAGNKLIWVWSTQGHEVTQAILAMLWPYCVLSPVERPTLQAVFIAITKEALHSGHERGQHEVRSRRETRSPRLP
jgi:hypothetical protein